MKKILFVCSGNTCRSALAEGIARKVFSDTSSPQWHLSSAGTSATEGLPASNLAVEVAKAHSVDLSGHRARLLRRSLVLDADLIVVMTPSHRDTVGVLEPSALAYTCLLTDFCDEVEGDVPDPIGMAVEVYEKTFSLLEKCIQGMKTKLQDFDGWK